MELKLNINPKLLIRLTEAIEQLASDYATVNAETLINARTAPSKEQGKMFYQSDRALWEQEQKVKGTVELDI